MAGIIPEIVNLATNENVSVTELLRKVLAVAHRLDLPDIIEWVEKELSGYNNTEKIPKYRYVRGILKVIVPPRLYMHWEMPNEEEQKKIETVPLLNPISEMNSLINKNCRVRLSPEEKRILKDIQKDFWGSNYEPIIDIPSNEIHRVIETIKDYILRMALSLEKKGIIGEGMTFSKEEKQIVQQQNYHFRDVIGSQIQAGSSHSSQTQNHIHEDKSELLSKLISNLDAVIKNPGQDIEQSDLDELKSELDTLKAQNNSPKPKWPIINATVECVRDIVTKVSIDAISSNILPIVSGLLN